MKNISLLLILLITGFTSVDAQKVVKTELYEIFYSELFEQPISVQYSYPNPFEFVFTREVVPFKVESVAITAQVHAQAFQVNKIEYSENIGSYVDGNGNFTKNKIYDVDTDNQEISFPPAKTTKIDTVTSKDWKVPLGIHTSDKDDYSTPYHRGHLVPSA